MCESSSGALKPGTNDAAMPTTTMISAGSSPLRWAMAVTTIAPTTTRMSSTRRLSRQTAGGARDRGLHLAGGAPEQVAGLHDLGANRRTAHPSRLPRPPVDVAAGPAAQTRLALVVLAPDGDDLAAGHPDLHQCDQIGPRGVELCLGQLGARPVRL